MRTLAYTGLDEEFRNIPVTFPARLSMVRYHKKLKTRGANPCRRRLSSVFLESCCLKFLILSFEGETFNFFNLAKLVILIRLYSGSYTDDVLLTESIRKMK